MARLCAPFLLLLLLLLLFGCQQPPPTQETGAYYEIVVENSACPQGLCFSEYIVTESGLMLKKEITGSMRNAPKIGLAKAAPGLARAELEYVKNNIQQSNYPVCTKCTVYHFFYHDSNETIWYGAKESDTSGFVRSVMSRSEALFLSSPPQEGVFAQLVYRKFGAPVVDFHIFDDGTVIREEFGDWEAPLLNARMGAIDPLGFDSAISGFFEYADNGVYPKDCIRQGFEYSSLEASRGNGATYNLAYTCGAGNSSADIAFNKLLALVEK
ncbi:MAG: hypothetical protein ABIF01_05635 [Candidatus Micrarchaeota archaeon]